MAETSTTTMSWAISSATADADPEVIADALVWWMQRDAHEVARLRAPAAQRIRALWARLHSTDDVGEASSTRLAICLREMLDVHAPDDILRKQWRNATSTFYACGSSQTSRELRKAHTKLAKLVASHGGAAAAQEMARLELAPLEPVMAMLAIDGSPTSLALLDQYISEAIERDDSDELRYLHKSLEVQATSEEARAVVGRIAVHQAAQSSIAHMILWFGTPSEDINLSFVLLAVPRAGMPRISMLVHVSNEHFTLALSEDETGRATTIRKTGDDTIAFITGRDDFELGACIPTELPAFLRRAAEKLGIEWDHDSCQLEAGTRNKVVARWLRTGELPSRKSGLDPRYYS